MAMSGDKNEMLDAAQRMWSLLDHLYETNPEEYKKFVDQQMKEGKEMLNPPEPVFCLKCNVIGDRKSILFINVCKWIRVPKPKTDNDPIPVKGGVLRHVIDTHTRKKSRDLVVDVAFNPYVLDECLQDCVMESMLVSLCQNFVEDVTKLKIQDRKKCTKIKELFQGPQSDLQHSLDEQWRELLSPESQLDIGDSILKQLSKMRSHGDKDDSKLPTLKLFKDQGKKKLIEELNSSTDTSLNTESNGVITARTPEHSIVIREPDSKHSERRVYVRVTLPGVKSVREVELEVSEDDLQVNVDSRYTLTVRLPMHVNEDRTKATFSSKLAVLSVTMPCL